MDFGCGFYVTPLYEQAVKWCGKFKRCGKDGMISRYMFDESCEDELKVLKFDSYSEEWLEFILNCRREKDMTDYDLVVGGVANDRVFNTVELYFEGIRFCFKKIQPCYRMFCQEAGHLPGCGTKFLLQFGCVSAGSGWCF